MLTIFRQFMTWAAHSPSQPPTQAERHGYCRESEFCFFNHSATLPFNQVNECHDDHLRHDEKSLGQTTRTTKT
ncbi:hypothetical protein Bresa_02184|uniref:Uncharacterized protein n=1 Tax=Brenneria salicis ATCC 15712 = DSM 30166 TaxID=714314 RepID=A0A366I4Q3_9GAMM|nr:hypothetical protein [Brenneria salicis ATCC 15712 = DSM 30166]RBP62829.1 hypothetical protein DES54_1147 [Brenneria salicis ATCC 15712 = DSM 30166]